MPLLGSEIPLFRRAAEFASKRLILRDKWPPPVAR
jgi:hypothetical protein